MNYFACFGIDSRTEPLGDHVVPIDTVQKKCVKLKICNFKLLTINLQTNELYTRTNL